MVANRSPSHRPRAGCLTSSGTDPPGGARLSPLRRRRTLRRAPRGRPPPSARRAGVATSADGPDRRSRAIRTPRAPPARPAAPSPEIGSCTTARRGSTRGPAAAACSRRPPARRRLPQGHAALVPLHGQRLRRERPPRLRPPRPPGDRPARRLGRPRALTRTCWSTSPTPTPRCASSARILAPGGRLALQVPVLQGETAPPTEPEFHGDNTPVFWRFGFDLTDRLRSAGFDTRLACVERFADMARTRRGLPSTTRSRASSTSTPSSSTCGPTT